MARVIVVGAGVVGLSCAVRLLEAGHTVGVVARDLSQETTSAVSAGLWHPHRIYPFERSTAWAAASYAAFSDLVFDESAGVVLRPGTIVERVDTAEPWWSSALPSISRTAEVPPGYSSGWSYVAPVVEMPVYLDWLMTRIVTLGGTVTRMALSGLPDQAEVVVNASGLGARLLGDDAGLQPVRGQVLYLDRRSVPSVDRWWLDEGGPTYVVPRISDVVVGGTEDEGVWDRAVSADGSRAILARAIELVPALRGAKVLRQRVGLRPARPTVRLESVLAPDGRLVVHCYGHGGAGVTVSWGCADEVVAAVERNVAEVTAVKG